MQIKFNIAGLQYHDYQKLPEIQDNMPHSLSGAAVDLIPEPTNEFDKGAIKIVRNDIFLGYVPKKWNVVIHGMLKDHDMKAEIAYYDPNAVSHKAFGILCTFTKRI